MRCCYCTAGGAGNMQIFTGIDENVDDVEDIPLMYVQGWPGPAPSTALLALSSA